MPDDALLGGGHARGPMPTGPSEPSGQGVGLAEAVVRLSLLVHKALGSTKITRGRESVGERGSVVGEAAGDGISQGGGVGGGGEGAPFMGRLSLRVSRLGVMPEDERVQWGVVCSDGGGGVGGYMGVLDGHTQMLWENLSEVVVVDVSSPPLQR